MKTRLECLKSKLKKRGVTVEVGQAVVLRCAACRVGWSPNFQPGGKFRRGYSRCPNGCNANGHGVG